MTRDEHKKECLEKLGNEWDCVHRWLDAIARDYFPFKAHRQVRHHTKGVEEVRKMWGDEAAKAAELHIIADEGYVPTPEGIRKAYGPLPTKQEVARERKRIGIK